MKTQHTATFLAMLMAGASSTALAQSVPATTTAEAPVALQEVIVTSMKRSENLQNVPAAISAISATALSKAGVFETSDLSHIAPNLQVSSPYGSQQPNFTVRGIGVGTEFNANAASPVGVYVDEVYQAFRSSHGQQLYDLDQVEVVRGPQGTLYGRNTTGGAINFITHKPSLSGSNGNITAGYGSYNRFNVEGAYEFTPIDNVLGIRVSGTYVKADPYVHNTLKAGVNTSAAFGASGLNLNTGRDPGGNETYGLRGIVRYRPTDKLEMTFKAYAAKSTGGTETPIPTGQSKTSDVINYTSPNFLLGGFFSALGPAGAGLLPGSYSQSALGNDINHIQADTVGEAISRSEGGVFTASYAFNDNLKLTSVSGYDSGLYSQSQTDCDATPLRLCSIGYKSSFHAINQDVRLDYHQGPVKLIVGAFYGQDSITADNTPDFFNFTRDVNAALGLPRTYFNPGGAFNGKGLSLTSTPTGITATQHFRQERTSAAVYGEGSYELTDTVKLTAGLRFTSDENDFHDGLTTYYDDAGNARMLTVSGYTNGGAFAPYFLQDVKDQAGNVVIPAALASPGPRPAGLERRGSSDEMSGRVILDWKPTETSLVYASYSHGYRAGTYNGLAYGSANQVYFVAPEKVDAYEAGFKSRFFDKRLQINGAVFYYDYQGQQGQVVDATATANLISLDGTMQGLELDVQYAATSDLTLNASVGLLDSEYASGACPTTPITGFPAQVGSCVVSSGGKVSVAGNPFPYAPESSVNLGFDWNVMKLEHGKIELHGDAAYTGQFYYDAFKDYSAGPLPTVASGKFGEGAGKFWVLNARLTYRRDNYSVSAWVKNLTDEVYYPFGISIENLFGNGYRVRAQPRMAGVEASVKF